MIAERFLTPTTLFFYVREFQANRLSHDAVFCRRHYEKARERLTTFSQKPGQAVEVEPWDTDTICDVCEAEVDIDALLQLEATR